MVDLEAGSRLFPGVFLSRRRGLFGVLDGERWLSHTARHEVELESAELCDRYELWVDDDQDEMLLRQLFVPSFVVLLAEHPLAPCFEYRAGTLVAYVERRFQDEVIWTGCGRSQLRSRSASRRRSSRPRSIIGVESATRTHEASGLAHVATVSFLASRAAPSIGFWVALAGGVALARAAQRDGARVGYGASAAATLQTVALIGPARFSVPLTQALSAPLIGALEARSTPAPLQVLAAGAIRLTHVTLTFAFTLFVLTGGVDVYTKSYEKVTGWTGFLPQGRAAALVLTGLAIVAWTAFASVVQVVVYRRGLARWPEGALAAGDREAEPLDPPAGRFDPRAVALAAGIAFALLLLGLSWALLGAVVAFLAIAALAGGGDRSVVPTGVALALLLGAGVFVFTLIGGLGADEALRRGLRALLFVLVATWLRAAAGASGLREVSRRALGRLGRVPPAREAAAVMDELGSGKQLAPAVRSVFDVLRATPVRPIPVVDAVLGWVVAESRGFRRAAPGAPMFLRSHLRDVALVALALACGVALFS